MNNNDFTPTRAMVIVAHPDDIEFGCAGTVAKWTKHGAQVVYVLVTSGNGGTHDAQYTRETIAVLREQEQTAAAAICGVSEIEFLHYQDGEVLPSLELRKDLVRMMRKHKPEVVVAMDPTLMFVQNRYINHPDHRAVATCTIDACFPIVSMPLMYPELGEAHQVREVWLNFTRDPADAYIDISDTLDLKMDALRQHKSQVDENTVQMVRTWALDEGRGITPVESFKIMFIAERT